MVYCGKIIRCSTLSDFSVLTEEQHVKKSPTIVKIENLNNILFIKSEDKIIVKNNNLCDKLYQ